MELFVIDNIKVYLHVYLIVNIQNMRTLMIPYAVVDTDTIYLPHDTDSFCWKCWVFDRYYSRFIARYLSICFPKQTPIET